jgi:CheY-like chemotaxis protein
MKTVLIIEDDRVVAATYRQKFKEAGFRVEVAVDGVEGVKLVSTLRPDAVVLDLLMPRLDGIEVLKFIRGHPELSATPVVVFSNSYMTNLVESAWRAGADECLMKASTMPKQLLDSVNKVMSRTTRRPSAPAPAMHPSIPAPVAVPVVDPLGSVIPAQMRAASTPIPAPPAPPASARTNIVFDIPSPSATPPAAPAGDRFTITYGESAPAPTKPSGGTTFLIAGSKLVVEPDTEFHAQIRELFLNTSAARLETIRALAAAFVQASDEALRAQQLETLFRKVHALAGNAGLAGCTTIAHFATTFEVLLKDLRDQPAWLTGSTLNSVARAVESLEAMFVNPEQLGAAEPPRLSGLVVEADPEAARTAAAALEAARITATIAEDPVYAIGLLATTPFDLVVAAIHLQDMTGFELFAQMEAMPQHQQTPVVFTTTHDNFASYLLDDLVARQDLIARPYPSIELTLKALARARRSAFQP